MNRLVSTLKVLPNSREKAITQFYLEELRYRFWRLGVGHYCLCTDLDFVEYRPSIMPNGWRNLAKCNVVGLIEVKTPLSARCRPRNDLQQNILKKVAFNLDKPLWLVTFTKKLDYFSVERLDKTQKDFVLSENEYKQWLINMGKKVLRVGCKETR